MSVTFYLQISRAEQDAAPAQVTCGCPGAAAHVFTTGLAADMWCAARNAMPELSRPVLPGCQDPELCRAYCLWPTAQLPWADLEVNMTYQNTVHILELLGLIEPRTQIVPQQPDLFSVVGKTPRQDEELCGQAPGLDILGRVLVALATAPDDHGISTVADGNLVQCGRRPGYTQQRLNEMHDLAQAAVRYGRDVVWA